MRFRFHNAETEEPVGRRTCPWPCQQPLSRFGAGSPSLVFVAAVAAAAADGECGTVAGAAAVAVVAAAGTVVVEVVVETRGSGVNVIKFFYQYRH